jgi:hypothetical protein
MSEGVKNSSLLQEVKSTEAQNIENVRSGMKDLHNQMIEIVKSLVASGGISADRAKEIINSKSSN